MADTALPRSSTALQQAERRPKKRSAPNPNHQACTPCKHRKVRCDAARPRCSYCASHDKPCAYPPMYKRAKCSQAHVEEMEAKLRQYERQLGAVSPAASFGVNGFTVAKVGQIQASKALEASENAIANVPGLSPEGKRPSPPTIFQSNSDRQHPSSPHSRGWNGPNVDKSQPEMSACPSAGVIDSDVDQDGDVDSPIMDGMVEYMGSFPEDRQLEHSFNMSPTFNFALKIKASTVGEGPKLISDRAKLAVPDHGTDGIRGALVSSSTTGMPSSTRIAMTRPEAPVQQDNFRALKSYLNQSYMHYLPRLMVGKALLDRYFSAVNTIWPFLVEDVTREHFDQIWSSDESPSPILMAQLNLVFALACQFYETEAGAPLPDVYAAGKDYYLRGHGFVIAHAFDTCSTTMLQTILLVIQYQQGTMRSNECWLMTGHATRMALGLRVHTSPPANSSLDPMEIELHKRLWWGCFSLDRVCSMIYGRPIGLPHIRTLPCQNNLPQSVDDKYIALGTLQPDGVPSINAFFVNSTNLYRVMDEIIERLHQVLPISKSEQLRDLHLDNESGASSCNYDAARQLTAILQLDGLLQNWHDSLPPHLKFSFDELDQHQGYSWEIQRQRVILKIRFLGMRILLHRQTILFLLQDSDKRRWPRTASQKWPLLFSDDPGEPLATPRDDEDRKRGFSSFEIQLAHLSAKMCVESAQLQIETIDHWRSLGLTGAWWWDFHFVFNALCVLFGAMGLRKDDRFAVISHHPNPQNLMRRGVSNIHDMAARGGTKVVQSERFLKRLMKAALQKGQRETHSISGGLSMPIPPGDCDGLAATQNADESLPQALSAPVLPSPTEFLGEGRAAMREIDWLSAMENAFAYKFGQNDFYLDGSDTPDHNDYATGDLLQSSFDTWAAFEGNFQPPINK